MSRLLGFLVHNWPLKVGAIVLATVAYSGLVLSQNARTWPGPVPIQVINQPTSAFIVGQLANEVQKGDSKDSKDTQRRQQAPLDKGDARPGARDREGSEAESLNKKDS